jgi:hypothetical protein
MGPASHAPFRDGDGKIDPPPVTAGLHAKGSNGLFWIPPAAEQRRRCVVEHMLLVHPSSDAGVDADGRSANER